MADTFGTSQYLLPPILEYSYRDMGENADAAQFDFSLSIINDDSQLYPLSGIGADGKTHDYSAACRAVRLDDNSSAIKDSSGISEAAVVTIADTSGTSATGYVKVLKVARSNLDIGDHAVNLRIQFALMDKDGKWSDWSNGAIVRIGGTIKASILPTGQTVQAENVLTLTVSSILWSGKITGLEGDERVSYYQFSLSSSNIEDKTAPIIEYEKSPDIYIKDGEAPTYQWRFATPFEDQHSYKIIFKAYTNYGGELTSEQTFSVKIPFRRYFDIFTIEHNDDEAYNKVVIEPKICFVLLDGKKKIPIDNFIQDTAAQEAQGGGTYTHLHIKPGSVLTNDENFQTAGGEFSAIIAAKNIKTYKTEEEAMANPMFVIDNSDMPNLFSIVVAATDEYLIVKKRYKTLTNTQRITFDKTKEALLVIKSNSNSKPMYLDSWVKESAWLG